MTTAAPSRRDYQLGPISLVPIAGFVADWRHVAAAVDATTGPLAILLVSDADGLFEGLGHFQRAVRRRSAVAYVETSARRGALAACWACESTFVHPLATVELGAAPASAWYLVRRSWRVGHAVTHLPRIGEQAEAGGLVDEVCHLRHLLEHTI